MVSYGKKMSNSESDSEEENSKCIKCGDEYPDNLFAYDNVCYLCVEESNNSNDDNDEIVNQFQQTTIVDDAEFTLKDIQKDKEKSLEYLKLLPNSKTLKELIKKAHELCPELERFCEENKIKLNCSKSKDKGNLGKTLEFYIFGQLPNSNPNPDLSWGADIKTTQFKRVKKDKFNAKERLTITNCGNTNDYNSFSDIINSNKLSNCNLYNKLCKGVLFVFEYTNGKYNDIEDNLNKKILCCIHYDLSELNKEILNQLEEDFQDIKNRIINKNIHQGQKYLHICKLGNKKCTTHALAFTNKFLTKLVSIKLNKPIIEVGVSHSIEEKHFK